jgi:putative TIM-barrel protein, nifR3 family
MKIGNTNLRGNLILAPLAGYTDCAFRQIATEHGADCCVTEMVSAEGLARDGEKTKDLIRRFEGETDLIVQIFAYAPSQVARCLDSLLTFSPTAIDINCGCPVQKVVKTGAGSALMAHPEKIEEMVRIIKGRTDIPVSVKFRLGWTKDEINYLEFAEAAVAGGANMLTMHARTRAQGYAGTSDMNEQKILKEHFPSVPVFCSGDVLSPEKAKEILEFTKADGLMFARGAIGNPFIFEETKSLFASGSYTLPTPEERCATMEEHLRLMVKYYGERKAVVEFRKHIAGYVKGLEGGHGFKQKAMGARTLDEYLAAIDTLAGKN